MKKRHNKEMVPLAKALRNNMTKEEKHLWYDFLRTYPIQILRQKIIGNYIVDFYCAKAKLIIELDGGHHGEEIILQRDNERTLFLESYGLQVLRIPNYNVNNNFRAVCLYIDQIIRTRLNKNASFV